MNTAADSNPQLVFEQTAVFEQTTVQALKPLNLRGTCQYRERLMPEAFWRVTKMPIFLAGIRYFKGTCGR